MHSIKDDVMVKLALAMNKHTGYLSRDEMSYANLSFPPLILSLYESAVQDRWI